MRCWKCQADLAEEALFCDQCGATLGAAPAAPLLAPLPAGTPVQGNNYVIERVLGQGGFGITYAGQDLILHRPVAIKEYFPYGCLRNDKTVMPGSWTTHDFAALRAHFLEEARTLARFRHPDIVQVFTALEENNTAYMVMEFLQGKDLAKSLRERGGTLPEAEAVALIRQVGAALTEVHRRNILHRDIKPSNIILTDDGRAVLVDFGAARQFAMERTQHHSVILTQGYAPIEQYSAEAKRGPFTDVYALGATLYHLLTGQPPVAAPARLTGTPCPTPHERNAAISNTVSQAVMWALETAPEKRPQTVQEWLEALAGHLPQKTAEVPTPIPAEAATHEAAPPPPTGVYGQRVREILQHLRRIPPPPSPLTTCPACRQTTLTEVTGQATRQCPLCRSNILQVRTVDFNRCPTCRAQALQETYLRVEDIICPLCRRVVLRRDVRQKDEYLVCPQCQAEWSLRGMTARLERFAEDPTGVGARYLHEALPLGEWRRISERAGHFLRCGRCGAQWDEATQQRWHLVIIPDNVPSPVPPQTALTHLDWAKIASGVDPQLGNWFCSRCGAEFDVTVNRMVLKSFRTDPHGWGQKLLHKPVHPSEWYFAASGKRNLVPGYICSKCGTEFDIAAEGAKLVATSSDALQHLVHRSFAWENWHRLAQDAPTRLGEQKLRLELQNVVKSGVMAGEFGLTPRRTRVALRKEEVVRWESQGRLYHQRTKGNVPYWDLQDQGTLVVTTERAVLDGQQLWQQPLSKVDRVDESSQQGSQHLVLVTHIGITLCRSIVDESSQQGSQHLVLWVSGRQTPLALEAPNSITEDVQVEGETFSITLTSRDLAALLRGHAQTPSSGQSTTAPPQPPSAQKAVSVAALQEKGPDVEEDSLDYARAKVTGPAVALLVVCSIFMGLLLLALAFDAWLVLSGTAGQIGARRGTSHETAITIRILWGILMLVTNGVILAGAVQMKRLRNRVFSRLACILALIPCLGPCFVLGIPFGIWGLAALNDSRVQDAFVS